MSTGFIYALEGPEGIRYVGLTRRSLLVRWQAHAREAAYGKRAWHVYNWWRTLDEPPRIVALEKCAVELLAERERYWIRTLREQGVRLCNHTDGGQGGVPDEATRAKISAKAKLRYQDPAERAKVAAVHKQRFSDPAARAKASATARERFSQPEYRRKMSAAITQRFARQDERDRLRDLTMRSWQNYTPEERAARCAAMSAGRAKAREARSTK